MCSTYEECCDVCEEYFDKEWDDHRQTCLSCEGCGTCGHCSKSSGLTRLCDDNGKSPEYHTLCDGCWAAWLEECREEDPEGWAEVLAYPFNNQW